MKADRNVINKRVSDDVVLDIGKCNKIIGIEILEASTHVDLSKILPIQHEGIKSTG
jgi:uncharacterized protein YuzE